MNKFCEESLKTDSQLSDKGESTTQFFNTSIRNTSDFNITQYKIASPESMSSVGRARRVRLKPVDQMSVGSPQNSKGLIFILQENPTSEKQIIRDLLQPEPVHTVQQLVQQDIKKIQLQNEVVKAGIKQTRQQAKSHRITPPSKSKSKSHGNLDQRAIQKVLESAKVPVRKAVSSLKLNIIQENTINQGQQTFSNNISQPLTPNQSSNRFFREQISDLNGQEFYNVLKDFQRIDQQRELYGQKENIYLKMIQQAYQHNMLPKKSLLTQNQNLLEEVRVNHCGQQSMSQISQQMSCPQLKDVALLDLSKNQLQDKLICQYLSPQLKRLKTLILDKCHIDTIGIYALIGSMNNLENLTSLSLEDNKFQDLGCIQLCQRLIDFSSVEILNLSKNKLTSLSCDSLAKLLKKHKKLRELYLHYNAINQKGGAIIFKALQKNKTIKVLDLSFNSLGNQNQFYQLSSKQVFQVLDQREILSTSECVDALGKILSKGSEILHLDLSHNNFTLEETKEIAQIINKNRTTIGFHYFGNQDSFRVDEFGYLVQNQTPLNGKRYPRLHLHSDIYINGYSKASHQDRVNQQMQLPQVHKRIQGFEFVEEYEIDSHICWICGGWQEIQFHWIPHQSGQIVDMPIYIHLSCFQYKPLLMTKEKDRFTIKLFVPRNSQIFYFYSNPVQGVQTIARDQMITESPSVLRYQNLYYYTPEIMVDSPPILSVNYIEVGCDFEYFDEQLNPTMTVKPRDLSGSYDFSPYLNESEIFDWQVYTSFFANYRPVDEQLISACFEFDFENSKISRLVKEEQETIKTILSKIYPSLFNAYKHYASYQLQQIPNIPLQSFYTLLSNTSIMDSKLKQNDIDVMFLSSAGRNSNYNYVVDKGLVRSQFMEMLVRVAIDKYQKSGQVRTVALAVERLFEYDGLRYHVRQFESPQDWRNDRFWNEQCETLIVKSLPFLKYLFKYALTLNQKQKPPRAEYLIAKDFKDLIELLGVYSENLSDRDVYFIYLISIGTQIDELNSPKHFQMNFYEFVEALARIAEKLTVVLPERRELNSSFTHMSKPLEKKIQGFLLICYFRLKDTIKEYFYNNVDDDDYYKLDMCMMGQNQVNSYNENQYRRFQRNKSYKQSSNTMLKSERFRQDTSFSPKNSSSESSDDSVDIERQEQILNDQIKPLQQNISSSTSLSKRSLLQQKVLSIRRNGSVQNILKFMKSSQQN